MGLLAGQLAYLCGPIDDAKDYGIGWRSQITPQLKKLGVGILDPTHKKIIGLSETSEDILRRKELKKSGRFEELKKLGQPIRHVDLRMVDFSGLLIVYFDLNVQRCGTFDEMFLADTQQKPVLIVCPQGLSEVPDWLWWSFPIEHFFSNFDDLFTYLKDIDSGKKNHDSFVFINLKEILEDAFADE